MIRLTRLNGTHFYLNAEHIQSVEATPDTHVLLTNGQHYVVLESAPTVAGLVLDYERRIHEPWVARWTDATGAAPDGREEHHVVPFPGRTEG